MVSALPIATDDRDAGRVRPDGACASIRDMFPLGDGELRCDGCERPYPVDALSAVDAPVAGVGRACLRCLEGGRVLRCCECRRFVRCRMPHERSMDRVWFEGRVYCDECRPPLSLVVRHPTLPGGAAVVPVDPRFAIDLPTNYLLDRAAALLGVAADRVRIAGMPRDKTISPSGSIADVRSRTFDVELV